MKIKECIHEKLDDTSFFIEYCSSIEKEKIQDSKSFENSLNIFNNIV